MSYFIHVSVGSEVVSASWWLLILLNEDSPYQKYCSPFGCTTTFVVERPFFWGISILFSVIQSQFIFPWIPCWSPSFSTSLQALVNFSSLSIIAVLKWGDVSFHEGVCTSPAWLPCWIFCVCWTFASLSLRSVSSGCLPIDNWIIWRVCCWIAWAHRTF